jgi:TRAP-type C4-dicarboxylate transport system permease small subunit
MPLCQVLRGNIIVDFFTAGLKPATNDKLDRLGALLLAAIFGLLAWRSTVGGLSSYNSHSETQIMGFPEWVVYAVMVPAFALAALIALQQAVFGFGGTQEAETAI